MKRIIAVFLAVLLSISLAGFAEGEYTPELSEDNLRELVVTGVLSEGISADDSSLQRVVTRGEFAEFISNTFNSVSEGFVADKVLFKDVPSDHKQYNDIMYMVSSGFMKGYGDGTFLPEKEIKRTEVIKTIVSILGYDYMAAELGGYPGGYEAVAVSLNITNGVSFDYGEHILKDEILKIIINSLDVPLTVMKAVGTDGLDYHIDPSKTIRTEYMKLIKAKGLVTANELVAVKGSKAADGYIMVDESLHLKISDLSYMDFVGLNVEFIYRVNEGEINELLLMYTTEKNKVLVLNRRDFIDLTSQSSANTLKYEINDKTKTARITKDAVYIKNGALLSNPSKTDFKNVVAGEFKLISTDGNSDYNVVIIRSFNNMLVGSTDISKYNVFSKNTNQSVNLDPELKTVVIKDENGNLIDFADIKPETVITAIEGAGYAEVYVSKKTVSGHVSSKETDKWTLNDAEYYLAADKKATLTAGNISYQIKAYLNYQGEIVFAENLSIEGTLAYLMQVAPKNSPVEQALLGEYFIPSTGKVVSYKFAEYVAIDENYAINDISAISSALTFTGGQCVKIWLNDKDEVMKVDTPVAITSLMGTDKDGFCMTGRKEGGYDYTINTKSFEFLGYIGDNTYFYNIPADMTKATAENFTVVDYRSPYMSNGSLYDVNMFFESKDDIYPSFIASYTDTLSTLSAYNFPAVFKKVTAAVDDNGENIYKVYFIGNTEGSFDIEADNATGVNFFKGLTPGDVFSYILKPDGKLGNQAKIYSRAGVEADYKDKVHHYAVRITPGTVTEVNSEFITLDVGSTYERYFANSFKVITVYSKKDAVGSVVSVNAKYGNLADIAINDSVIFYSTGGTPKAMIIYKQ